MCTGAAKMCETSQAEVHGLPKTVVMQYSNSKTRPCVLQISISQNYYIVASYAHVQTPLVLMINNVAIETANLREV